MMLFVCLQGAPSGPSEPQTHKGCRAVGLGSIPLTCWDLSVIVFYLIVVVAALAVLVARHKSGQLKHLYEALSPGNQDSGSGDNLMMEVSFCMCHCVG